MQISPSLLPSKERQFLEDSFFGWIAPLCRLGWTSHLILGEIVRNTIATNQVEWHVNLEKYFLAPENGFAGMVKRRQMYHSLSVLEKIGLIEQRRLPSKKAVRLNLPGILYTIQQLWGNCALKFKWKAYISQWYSKFSEVWIQQGWELCLDLVNKQEHLMKLKDSIDAANKQSSEARKRQREKKKAKEEKNARFVIECMKEAYEEHLPGVAYRETWTAKLKGMAKNWIAELQTTDPPIDPARVIDDFVKSWSDLSGRVKDPYGNHLILGDLPTFQTYYRFRKQIEEGLRKLGKDSMKQSVFSGMKVRVSDHDTGEETVREY